jgi:fumarate reductase subunit D
MTLRTSRKIATHQAVTADRKSTRSGATILVVGIAIVTGLIADRAWGRVLALNAITANRTLAVVETRIVIIAVAIVTGLTRLHDTIAVARQDALQTEAPMTDLILFTDPIVTARYGPSSDRRYPISAG